jgi:hypothetical protein
VSPLAYKTALADLRSQVDWYVERLSADEAELAALRRRPGARLRRLLRGR